MLAWQSRLEARREEAERLREEAFQWLYILFVILGIAIGVMGIRATIMLIKGADKSYSDAMIALIAGVVVLVACVSKGGACWAAARWHGEDNRTALAIGTLMNSRGLMELIIINIGLQKGVIQAPLFSILVLMAIVTTLMTSPVFEWVYGRHERKEGRISAAPAPGII